MSERPEQSDRTDRTGPTGRTGRTNRTTRPDRAGETMADVDHTHPDTNEPFGGVYRRGPAVTDGGTGDRADDDRPEPDSTDDRPEPDSADDRPEPDPADDRDVAEEAMMDVDHTPHHGDGASGVWERGTAGDDRGTDGGAPPDDEQESEATGAESARSVRAEEVADE